jgi:phosphoglycolate phosphatase
MDPAAPDVDRRRRMTQSPAAVLFDLDGTLVDTVQTRIDAWMQTFEELHVPVARAALAALIGSDGRRLARIVVEGAGEPIDAAQAEAIDRRSGEIYDLLNVHPRAFEDAKPLLTLLDERRIPWAIATSSRRDQVGASINALGLAKRPTVIDGSHVENAKPAPDLLLFAAREINVEPSVVWYVGDSTWDMQAAVAAGMPAVGVATGAATKPDLKAAGAWLTFDGLGELSELIRHGPRQP